MTKNQRAGILAFSLVLLVSTGCATKPIAKQYRQKADAEDVTFPMVLQNPETYVGDVVLWGGVIIETKNVKNGTDITVLETPLKGSERPKGRSYSRGRFIAHSSKLLDPEIYRNGRKITLAGVVRGKETLPLGETSYTYPVVSVKQLYLWEPRPNYAYPYSYWGPYGAPYWGPYWGWGPSFGFYGEYDEDLGRREEMGGHEERGETQPEEHAEHGGDQQ